HGAAEVTIDRAAAAIAARIRTVRHRAIVRRAAIRGAEATADRTRTAADRETVLPAVTRGEPAVAGGAWIVRSPPTSRPRPSPLLSPPNGRLESPPQPRAFRCLDRDMIRLT